MILLPSEEEHRVQVKSRQFRPLWNLRWRLQGYIDSPSWNLLSTKNVRFPTSTYHVPNIVEEPKLYSSVWNDFNEVSTSVQIEKTVSDIAEKHEWIYRGTHTSSYARMHTCYKLSCLLAVEQKYFNEIPTVFSLTSQIITSSVSNKL